jgi:hypothetical protein
MVDPAPPPRSKSAWRDTALLFVAAAGLLALLQQRMFHGMDAQYLIGLVRDGSAEYYAHKLYLPLMLAWHDLLSPLTHSPFLSMRAASLVGVALGTLFMHRASLALGLDRGRAALAAALTFAAPAVLFFGTVVELHGVFHAFLGLVFWQWARCGRGVDLPGQALLGAATAAAAGVHSSGHLLLALLPMLSFGWFGIRPRQAWRGLLVTIAAHVATTVLLTLWLVPAAVREAPADDGALAAAWAYFWPRLPWSPITVAAMLWREWGEPFAPLSLIVLAALFWRSPRRRALALLVGVLPLWGAVWVLLRAELHERGAYLLPFAWPAAVLAAEWLPRWLRWLALAVSLGLSVTAVVRHDRPADDPQLTAGLHAVVGDAPAFVICAQVRDVEQLQRDVPVTRPWPILTLASVLPQGYAALCAEFDRVVAAEVVAGRDVILTASALALLQGLALPDVQRFVGEHLAANYELEPLQARGYSGSRLQRRR